MQVYKHLVDRIKFTELNEIYWAMSLKTFAVSFVDVFIPIYLYMLGFSIQEILFFFFCSFGFKLILEEIIMRLIAKWGPKHIMAVSFLVTLMTLWLFSTISIYNWNLLGLAFINAIGMALFWSSYHVDFSKVKHGKHCTQEISHLYILVSFVGAIAPFIGGVIATRYGMNFSFLIAMTVLMVAIFPLFKTGEPHIARKIAMKKIKVSKIKNDLISYAGMGLDAAAVTIVWPFFIYFILGSYAKVGAVESLMLFLTIFASYFLGKYADHANRINILKRGSIVNCFLWLIKTVVSNSKQIVSLNILSAVALPFIRLPFNSEFYLHADEESRLEYITWMERAVDISRATMFLILYIISFYWEIKIVLIGGFIFAALGAFLSSFMRPSVLDIKVESDKDLLKV